ncbi:MAG: COX15/CtaA family protein [Actinomycetota bacterium]|nr:COX15/CtaA family protein [Actinomycetota bacterium]
MNRSSDRPDPTGYAPDKRARRRLATLALSTAIATYCLVVLGSTVRVTHSGMGCPGWPLCHGQIGPIDHFHALMEQSHRYLVVVVTILVVATAIAARRYRASRALAVPALAAAALIPVQIVLGAITVWTHNAPVTVALHLLMAIALLGLVTSAAAVAAARPPLAASPGPARRSGEWLGWSAAAAVFLVFVSGSLVVNGGAAKAWPVWPFGSFGHAPLGLVALQMAHRSMALVAGIAVAALVLQALRSRPCAPGARVVAWLLAALFAAQVAAGALVAVLRAPEALEDLHLALGAAIWCAVVVLATLTRRTGIYTITPAEEPGDHPEGTGTSGDAEGALAAGK